jgi:hypothetical protein
MPATPSSPDPEVPGCLAVLGLRPPVTLEDVKQSYLAKAFVLHPDRGGDPEAFVQLQAAFERGGEAVMEETDWLRKSFGEDFGHVADKLVKLTLNGPAADDTFAILVGFRADSLKDLVELDLAGGAVTDEGLLQLKGLKNLRRLDLRGTAVGKLGAEAAGWFEKLEFLGLPTGSVGMFARLAMPRRLKLELG